MSSVRLHGPKRWYRHDYSKEELVEWANRIKASRAKRAWIYFNNDNDAYAPKNATAMRRILDGFALRPIIQPKTTGGRADEATEADGSPETE
jgi:uncharacterized protein YecE (DUF72 family)